MLVVIPHATALHSPGQGGNNQTLHLGPQSALLCPIVRNGCADARAKAPQVTVQVACSALKIAMSDRVSEVSEELFVPGLAGLHRGRTAQ